jgi:lipopolysaccharide biosynthesis protein
LISFYLPQFHAIPENDAWWGKGFTEWTNVRRAIPLFPGHYQPKIPGDLGYYDLRNVSVIKKQIELAKLYGINGFCFYLYWFGGKRLLELPVKQFLNDTDICFPFCVCWANENWSKRWDGLDNEILIAQQHSPKDDLEFIEYISKYLKDPRYIRIKNKPLVIVYRPSLLPSAKRSAERWRNWCFKNGVGDIFLAYTQSFEREDPSVYGFDAAIEFPPNNSTPPVITGRIKNVSSSFSGTFYNWRIFVERSNNYKNPGYPLFLSVCPSWDNTARRMENSSIFLGSTPDQYREWLENAAVETRRRFKDSTERLIFINAWNEWAEGAYLEPDNKFGYAYLQATRDALENVYNLLDNR